MMKRFKKVILLVFVLNIIFATLIACSVQTSENCATTEFESHIHIDADMDLKCDTCNAGIACKHSITKKLDAKSPTCTETGLSEGKMCEICKAVIVEQHILYATGHELIEDGTTCRTCGIDVSVTYDSYQSFSEKCALKESNGIITLEYNRNIPIILLLNFFELDLGKTYILKFGPEASWVRLDGAKNKYQNVKIFIEFRDSKFFLNLHEIHIENTETVLLSNAPSTTLKLTGAEVSVQTLKSWKGKDGDYCSMAVQEGIHGQRGGDASPAVVCAENLFVICGTNDAKFCGGDGGDGGNGGDYGGTVGTGNGGGNGGDGGSGAVAISATSIRVSFVDGYGKKNIAISGGKGGLGGNGGYSASFAWFGTVQAPNGADGMSATSTSTDVQYE